MSPICSCRRSAFPAARASAATASCVARVLPRSTSLRLRSGRLGVPLPYDAGEPLLSAAAIAKPPVYDRARAAARYSATMRELIQSFKYRDRHEGLALFGALAEKGGSRASCRRRPDCAGATLSLAPLVAAVQSVGHARAKRGPARQRSRRLLRARPRAADIKPSRAFCRTKAEECRRSVQDAAGARRPRQREEHRGGGRRNHYRRNVEACARALKRAGAARVDVLALARAVEPAAFLL